MMISVEESYQSVLSQGTPVGEGEKRDEAEELDCDVVARGPPPIVPHQSIAVL